MISKSSFDQEHVRSAYKAAIATLEQLGVLYAVRLSGQPMLIDGGRNSSANAAEGARAFGYTQCLDNLMNFYEKFIDETPYMNRDQLRPKYGAIKRLIESGDYTKEELEEYERTGQLRSPLPAANL